MNSDTPKTDKILKEIYEPCDWSDMADHARSQERLINELCEALTSLLHITGDRPVQHDLIREALSKVK